MDTPLPETPEAAFERLRVLADRDVTPPTETESNYNAAAGFVPEVIVRQADLRLLLSQSAKIERLEAETVRLKELLAESTRELLKALGGPNV